MRSYGADEELLGGRSHRVISDEANSKQNRQERRSRFSPNPEQNRQERLRTPGMGIRSYLLRKGSNRDMEYYGRKKLLWDGSQMKITNLKDANQFVGREYRKGWEL